MCVYVCVCLCLCVCCVCMYVYACVYVCVYMCVYVCVFVYVFMCVYVCVFVQIYMYVCIYIHTYIYMRIHRCVAIYENVHMLEKLLHHNLMVNNRGLYSSRPQITASGCSAKSSHKCHPRINAVVVSDLSTNHIKLYGIPYNGKFSNRFIYEHFENHDDFQKYIFETTEL